ncbi:zinc-binding alcohol dehydrogenase family protein [Pedobacter sp. PAMC26386]|nr:zinc-binding alcohol dehydrogenase family protein [Pedobacter sp. PAMC26386]
MKALICKTPGEFSYINKDIPSARENMVLLKMKRLGICGTDYHAFEGTQPFFEYPRILGHEIAAEVVKSDDGCEFKPGDFVTISPYFSCGTCIACRSGKTNCCVSIKVFGVHIDGAMQEYISVPASAVVAGKGLTLDELALVEPLAISAHGVGLAQIKKGDTVLVLGAGPIGLGAMAFSRINGGEVIVIDVNDNRLAFCRDQFDVKYTINPLKADPLEQIKEITGGDMVKVVIDCTGNLNAINDAFRFLAHSGKFIMIGLQKGVIQILHPEFHKREAMLMSSRNALPVDFENVIDCISKNLIKPLELVTHYVPFDQVKGKFDQLLHAKESLIKALICFDE